MRLLPRRPRPRPTHAVGDETTRIVAYKAASAAFFVTLRLSLMSFEHRPSPARVTEAAAAKLPRWMFFGLLAAYIIPGSVRARSVEPGGRVRVRRDVDDGSRRCGRWWLPSVVGEPLPEEGPLPFWIGALMIRLFGGHLRRHRRSAPGDGAVVLHRHHQPLVRDVSAGAPSGSAACGVCIRRRSQPARLRPHAGRHRGAADARDDRHRAANARDRRRDRTVCIRVGAAARIGSLAGRSVERHRRRRRSRSLPLHSRAAYFPPAR